MTLYMCGGLAGSISFVMWPYCVRHFGSRSYSNYSSYVSLLPGLGASGAVCSVVMWAIANQPTRIVLLYMVLPVPAALFGFGFIFSDIFNMYLNPASGGAAHLGGSFFGAAYYLFRRYGRRRFR